jgi:hypothetical protein
MLVLRAFFPFVALQSSSIRLAGHTQALGHTRAVGFHWDCPSLASWHSGREGHAEVKDPEEVDLEVAVAGLDVTAGRRRSRYSREDRLDGWKRGGRGAF